MKIEYSKFQVVLTVEDLCTRWSVHPNTLSKWRTNGSGPKFFRMGKRRILYPISEIESWESAPTLMSSTAESHMTNRGPGVGQRKRT